jgi:7-keto-8-aminopelargonate synthetase-like enzyme
MEVSEFTATVDDMHAEAQRRGLFFQHAQDDRLAGRRLRLEGREVLAFTSCSYLGLEYHPAMIEGVKEAVDRYGTQFSASRAYCSAPHYQELEGALDEVFGGNVLVCSSTTMAHQAALPVLVTEKDAILYDNQVHHSVQIAITLCRANGTTVEMVRHREIEKSLEAVKRLAAKHRTVWFACDGVYSMFGDLAPFGLLRRILDVAPNVRIYVDDAHGMSWAGRHGRGLFLSHMPLSDRIVLATSFAKAYAAGGGCLVFADKAERELVHRAGAAQLFNGPMQPPMLGASLASAKVHLSEEIVERQRTLRHRVLLTNELLLDAGLPLLARNESPIFFLGMGRPDTAFAVAERMKQDDIYVNVSMYPTVPLKRSGIRLAITAIHSEEDIARTVEAFARHVPAVFAEQGVTLADIDTLFAGAVPEESRVSAGLAATPEWLDASAATDVAADRAVRIAAPSVEDAEANELMHGVRLGGRPVRGGAAARPAAPAAALSGAAATNEAGGPPVSATARAEIEVSHHRTIHEIDRAFWDSALGSVGACSWEAMALNERVFRDQSKREHNWGFHYLIARENGRPVGATLFADLLHKDDMLMRPDVSREVERRREDDPYFLTTRALAMGGYLSEGNHLWLDRAGPWQAALGRMLDVAEREYDRADAGMLILRDLPADDPQMDRLLLSRGYAKVPMLDSHILEITWRDRAGYVDALSGRARKRMRDRMAEAEGYRTNVYGARSGRRLSHDELVYLNGLYRNVAEKKFALNVFPYPLALFEEMQASPAWEIVTLTLDPAHGGPADGRPVAWYAAHVHGGHYTPFLVGIDYAYVAGRAYGAYRQTGLAMVERAMDIGCTVVHKGMDADFEKSLLGTRQVKTCVYAQIRDHYQGEILREIVTEVGLASGAAA